MGEDGAASDRADNSPKSPCSMNPSLDDRLRNVRWMLLLVSAQIEALQCELVRLIEQREAMED